MRKFKIVGFNLILTLTSFIAITCILFSACNPPEFCCLQYDLNTPEMTYCNDHSDIAGHFLLDAEEQSENALIIAAEQLDDFYQDADTCETADCIETMIQAESDLAGLWQYYKNKHDAAESRLVTGDINFTTQKRAQLILCGFKDAVERIREIIEKGR